MAEPTVPGQVGPVEDVREGMRVVDAAGEEVGRVKFVKLGDPEAITIQGEEVDNVGDRDEPDVSSPLRERLLRVGFIKVERKGLLRGDRYVSATDVARVDGDAVHLSIRREALAAES